jgi:hypothetical protein
LPPANADNLDNIRITDGAEYQKRWMPKMPNIKTQNVKITGGIDGRQDAAPT